MIAVLFGAIVTLTMSLSDVAPFALVPSLVSAAERRG